MEFWDKGKEKKDLLIVRGQVREVRKRADQAAAGRNRSL